MEIASKRYGTSVCHLKAPKHIVIFIGAALAQLEMKLVMATILKRFQLALTQNRRVKPVRRGLTFASPGNMRMLITQHRDAVTHSDFHLQKTP